MDKTQAKQIVQSVEILYKDVMGLYWAYFNFLEALVKRTPDAEVETLREINEHIKEVQSAMEHDMGAFEKAVDSDMEDVNKFKDNLKIQDIYNKLKK